MEVCATVCACAAGGQLNALPTTQPGPHTCSVVRKPICVCSLRAGKGLDRPARHRARRGAKGRASGRRGGTVRHGGATESMQAVVQQGMRAARATCRSICAPQRPAGHCAWGQAPTSALQSNAERAAAVGGWQRGRGEQGERRSLPPEPASFKHVGAAGSEHGTHPYCSNTTAHRPRFRGKRTRGLLAGDARRTRSTAA